MKRLRKSQCVPQPIPVEWIDEPAPIWRPGLRKGRLWRRGRVPLGHDFRPRAIRVASGFTILELMVVLAIIGFIAALALPHVAGFNRANAVSAATQQFLDDVALARQRAMSGRTTVYMVFVPPGFFNQNPGYTPPNANKQWYVQITNAAAHQYTSYALLALRSVGDQPGHHYPHYLTDWRVLPQGVYVNPFQFASNQPPQNFMPIYTTNTLSGITVSNGVFQFNWANVPFPSVEYGATYELPYIGFTPNGELTSTYSNQYIMLTRGSVLPAEDTNGNYIAQLPILTETPPGNATNNPCLIEVDWLTARGSVVQNQFK